MGEDIFEEVHTVDEREVQKGYDDGQRDGMVAGLLEGRQLGVQKGYEIGAELGFYAGCVRTWRALQAIEKDADHAMSQQPAVDAQQELSNTDNAQDATSNAPAEILSLTNMTIQNSASTSTDSTTQQGQRHDRQETHSQPAQSSTHSRLIPERAEKSLAGLEQMLKDFPLGNPQDERLHELLESIRGKFKAVASMLGLLSDYMPREMEAAGGSEQATNITGSPSSKVADMSF